MEVQAKFIGGNDEKGYFVNVRSANPKGMIGDAGFVRNFKTKEEAREYTESVNQTGQDTFVKETQRRDNHSDVRHADDKFVSKTKDDISGTKECPKIPWARVAFSRLTDEQIDVINESKKLPENAKIVSDGMGGYTLANNLFGFRSGTRTVPEGFEMKKNCMGFTVVVPKDTEGIFIKNAS